MNEIAKQLAKTIAQDRRNVHGHGNITEENHEDIGVYGELEFGRFCGQMPNLEKLPEGDGGVDFYLPTLTSVDVKTAKGHPPFLIHRVNKACAKIFVLADHDEKTKETVLVGWATANALKKNEPRNFGLGMSYNIEREKLRPMSELDEIIFRIERLRR